MICFVPDVCLSIRKSCQRRDCSELGTVRNWVDHCIVVVDGLLFYVHGKHLRSCPDDQLT